MENNKNEIRHKDTGNVVDEEKKQYIVVKIGDEQYGLMRSTVSIFHT